MLRLVPGLLVVLCCIQAPAAWAGKYAYGEQFVRQGQHWWEGDPSGAHLPAEQLDTVDIEHYQQQLAQLEQLGGPYADTLSEPLAALGRHHHISGDFAAAQHMLQRALHVVRVNDGLYSTRQVPILQSLLDTYRVGGQWQSLDERYDYYYRLFGHGKPPYTELRLRASLGYLRWQREALRLRIDEKYQRRLLALYRLNESVLEGVAGDPGVEWRWHRDLALSQLKNLYLIQDRVLPEIQDRGLVRGSPAMAAQWEPENMDEKQLQRIQRDAASRGARLLDGVINKAGSTDQTELAQLHLAKGDWYQWLGREELASGEYEMVVRLLQDSGKSSLLQQWLSQPVELPDNGVFWQAPLVQGSVQQQSISLRYDVSAQGRASNMSSEDVPEEARSRATRLKRKLRQVRFRPRWLSGEPEPVAQLQRSYILMD